ncbi:MULTISPECIES: YwqH-like family protein [Virgibacillus]|uniref:Uncharacterized protein n=2 Tax=Virgibacillus TaxID=84406 RepID=A0A024QG16_9BACI|nr:MULTISPECIES: DUF5082 family protein [Virgibacillus]EQB39026.1 hypothetical protein M948_01360 [Virgibacillus sp. CM-4]GGJ68403.1 hypothetical protein GCM10007111_32700 [Virgibacillus kapii]CDQ41150.1 hypothetical protein BN990_03505 [Virgibacillus massiliensis]
MESLHSINGQISRMQNSLYDLNLQLENRRRELERLALALSNLYDYKDDFKQNRKLCVTPELSPNTWHGQYASRFQQFKDNEVLANYISLYDYQLVQTIDQLNEKIREIKQSIIDIRMDLSNQRNELDHLYDKQRRELMS